MAQAFELAPAPQAAGTRADDDYAWLFVQGVS
jgi:hypothetical protein